MIQQLNFKPVAHLPTAPKLAAFKPIAKPIAKPTAKPKPVAKPIAPKATAKSISKPAAKPTAKPIAVKSIDPLMSQNASVRNHNNAILFRKNMLKQDMRMANKQMIEKLNNPQRKKCCS